MTPEPLAKEAALRRIREAPQAELDIPEFKAKMVAEAKTAGADWDEIQAELDGPR